VEDLGPSAKSTAPNWLFTIAPNRHNKPIIFLYVFQVFELVYQGAYPTYEKDLRALSSVSSRFYCLRHEIWRTQDDH
jgi:hypothetical protein